MQGATSDDAVAQLGPDPPLDRGDGAERVLEVAARERAEVVGAQVVVGALAGADLLDLVLEAQGADERERLLEHGPVVVGPHARGARGAQPRRRRALRRAGGQPGPASEVDDRDQTAVLEVEPALALAAVLDDEVAQEAGRRAVRQREAGEEPQQPGMRPRGADPGGERRGAADAPRRPPVADERHEDQRLLLRG